MQHHITETHKRSKLLDILSCFLTLTCLREGLQPLAPSLVAPLLGNGQMPQNQKE